ERAVTLAKSTVMALMCTTGSCGCAETLVMASVFLGPGPVHETRGGQNGAVGRDESVLSFRQCGFRLLRGEVGFLYLAPCGFLLVAPCGGFLSGCVWLDEFIQLVAQQRVALDDEVDVTLGQGFHPGLDGIDRDDLDVLARFQTGGLDRFDGTQPHVVVV